MDNNALIGATNAALTFTNAQLTNGGTYFVTVTDSSGEIFSSNAVLTVVAPVLITTPPTNQAATFGGSATFSVTANGSAPLSYQWSLNGTNIVDATNTTYTVGDIAFSNIGAYSVLVTDPWSFASASALLVFNPQITLNDQVGAAFSYTNAASVQVGISSIFTNATIFYTLDGTLPSFSSTAYSTPFALTNSATIRAVAYDQQFDSALSFPVYVTLLFSNTLAVSNPGGGTVGLNPPGGVYLSDQTVQLTATPTNGWQFVAVERNRVRNEPRDQRWHVKQSTGPCCIWLAHKHFHTPKRDDQSIRRQRSFPMALPSR